jgi:hypothetical protein
MDKHTAKGTILTKEGKCEVSKSLRGFGGPLKKNKAFSTCRYPKMAARKIASCHSQKTKKINATRHPADFKSEVFIVRNCIMSFPHFPILYS